MAFKPCTIDDGHVPPIEYIPAEAGTYKVGECLAIDTADSHQLDTSTNPTHICVADKVIATAGDPLPCIRIVPGMIFETELSANGTLHIGSAYWVTSDGLKVAATGTEGQNKFIADYVGGATAGSVVRGHFA